MAPAKSTSEFNNLILAGLSASSLKRLALTATDLAIDFSVYEPNRPFDSVYFPESGLLSVVSTHENGRSVEVGLVGREGISPAQLLLGAKSSPFRCFVQVAGHGFRTTVKNLSETVHDDPRLRERILLFENAFRIQTMQGMACSALHTVEQRCCRWLLMTHDRVQSDDLKLSHEFLAMMLGVRRASITEVLLPLQALDVLRSVRGTITIMNRRQLQERVCECYSVVRNWEALH